MCDKHKAKEFDKGTMDDKLVDFDFRGYITKTDKCVPQCMLEMRKTVDNYVVHLQSKTAAMMGNIVNSICTGEDV